MSDLDLTEAYGEHTPGTLYEYIDHPGSVKSRWTGECPDHGASPDSDVDPAAFNAWIEKHPIGEDGRYCLDRPIPGQFCLAEEHDDWETPWPCEYAEAINVAAPIIARQVADKISEALEREAAEVSRLATLPRAQSPYCHRGDAYIDAARIARGFVS